MRRGSDRMTRGCGESGGAEDYLNEPLLLALDNNIVNLLSRGEADAVYRKLREGVARNYVRVVLTYPLAAEIALGLRLRFGRLCVRRAAGQRGAQGADACAPENATGCGHEDLQ